jgi:hypothetical protein
LNYKGSENSEGLSPEPHDRDNAPRRTLLDIAACFAIGIGVALIPWLFRERFYFHDDVQHQHLPIFLHIGRLLRAGEPPFLSLASFTSGNLLGEYQFALLNPVSLALYAVLPSIPNLATAALFLACFFYGVLAAGMYALARSYQVERSGAGLAALVIASNNLIAYWFASSWFPIHVSLAWFVWAWAFLVRAERARGNWLLAALFSYLTITAGWPHTTLVLGLVGLLVAVQAWGSGGWRRSAASIAALAAATLLAAITLLALVSLGEIAVRPSGVANGNFQVPDLSDLLAMSSPFHRGFMSSYRGYQLTGTPIFFLAWFVVPLLPLIRWSRVEWRRPEVVALVVVAGFCLLATKGPDQFYMLRAPFRWVPYFHIALMMLFLALVSRAGFAPATPGRIGAVVLLAVLSSVLSLQADPENWPMHAAGLSVCLMGLAAFLAIPERQRVMRFGLLAAVSLLLLVATRALFPVNTHLADWRLPAEVEMELPANAVPSAYTLYLGTVGDPPDVERFAEFQTGMMPRVREVATVNGYTPIGHRFVSELLCMNSWGETCPEAAARLFERDPETGIRYVDLFRIDCIIAVKGPHLEALRPYLDEAWRLEFEGPHTQRFVRDLPNVALPGTVAWVSPNATVERAGRTRPTVEPLRIAKSPDRPATVVFARLWWPGYQAELDGRRLPVRAHRGIFAAVEVPAGVAAGVLTLRFRPPYLSVGIAGLVAGLTIILAVLVLHRRLFQSNPRQLRPLGLWTFTRGPGTSQPDGWPR